MSEKYEIGSVVFSNWVIVDVIGEGSFGKVFRIQRSDDFTTDYSALKVITVPHNSSELRSLIEGGKTQEQAKRYLYGIVEGIVDEIKIMSKLKATANVVSYEDHEIVAHKDGIGWDILIRMELLHPLLPYAYEHPFSRRDIFRTWQPYIDMYQTADNYSVRCSIDSFGVRFTEPVETTVDGQIALISEAVLWCPEEVIDTQSMLHDDTGRIGNQWQLLDRGANESRFKFFNWTSTTSADEEGVFWSYEYNEDGIFYCRRTSDMLVTRNWGDKQVSIGNWNVTPMTFSCPIENCSQFDFDFEFTDVQGGISVYGTQSVYVRSGSEQWKKMGSFNVDGPGEVTTTFTFDDPISFDQLVVVHPQTGQYIPTVSVWYDTYNIHCISYANAGEALLDSTEPI